MAQEPTPDQIILALHQDINKVVAINKELLDALKKIQNKLIHYDFLQSTNNNQGRVRAVLSLTATALAQVEKG